MRQRLLRLVCVFASLVLLSFSLAISYTVQIIAVSTEASASKLQAELADQGYTAYLVQVPTAEGPVFRIRVGSFANREAAALFAEAMTGVLDSSPTPALAEGIPASLVPLEAELVDSFSSATTAIQVLPWQGEVAFRTQVKDASEQALYRVVDIVDFEAWQAAPQSDGSIIRVYSHDLWPEAWTIQTQGERELSRRNTLQTLADELGFTTEQLEAFEFKRANGPPYLVLVEQFSVRNEETKLFKVLGQPASEPDRLGPELVWFDDNEVTFKDIKALFEAGLEDASTSATLKSREGWEARADGGFLEIENNDPKKTWRAAVGKPLWVRENWLLASTGGDVLLYRLIQK